MMSNQSIQYEPASTGGYNPGHPWYYKLGGRVLRPKEILNAVKNSDYQGYRKEEIQQIDAKDEPARSEYLRKVQQAFLRELKSDLSRYRQLARELNDHNLSGDSDEEIFSRCNDPFTSISLKHNHLYNDFAHLVFIDHLLSLQGDLFD